MWTATGLVVFIVVVGLLVFFARRFPDADKAGVTVLKRSIMFG